MTKARDVMIEDVAIVKASATVAEAVKLMKFKGIHSLIVDRSHDEDAYGIVTDSDIASQVVAYGKDPSRVRVYEVMTKPCIVVNPDLAVEYVARLFTQTSIDRAPVIKGDLLGIVSLQDILTKSDFLENPRVPLLEKALQEAVAKARTTVAQTGAGSAEAQAAWEAANELEAELSFCKGQAPEKTVFEQFGDTTSATAETTVTPVPA
ncbi:MAG: CBS domain-containing protein [Leptolyngbya sp. SIO1E4]|nr:CBS domain-containing protein [Leptolyngbya sp. SIO1E4]